MARDALWMARKETIRRMQENWIVQIQLLEELREMIRDLVTKIDIVEDTHKVPLQSSDVEFVPAKFPKFEGGDPTLWLHEAERFIDFYRVEEDRKWEITYFHMKGEAFQWFQRLNRAGQFLSWNQFKQALISRFGSSEFDDSHGDIAKLLQHLSPDELQAKREKGLCYNGDVNFDLGQCCEAKQRLLLCQAGDEAQEEKWDLFAEVTEQLQTEGEHKEKNQPQLGYYALAGQSTPKTLRIKGLVGGKDVIMLIDSGGTHNFIHESMANSLKLDICPAIHFTVLVGNAFVQEDFKPKAEINPEIHQPYVPWGNCCLEDATWNDAAVVYSNFPAMNLEDKVDFKGNGMLCSRVSWQGGVQVSSSLSEIASCLCARLPAGGPSGYVCYGKVKVVSWLVSVMKLVSEVVIRLRGI